MKRIAIVIPWYGEQARGGAETHAAELARHLAVEANVEVLTTTSTSFYHSWSDGGYAEGVTHEHGYTIRRFALDARNATIFDRANRELLDTDPSRWDALRRREDLGRAFLDHSINSSALVAYAASQQFDAVLALPYLFGVTVRVIRACKTNAYLVPCLHDEAYARLTPIREAFHDARGLLYLSEGEGELALRLYGPGILHKSIVTGAGVENAPARAVDGGPPVDGPYVLYVGRRDSTKNVDFLVDAFSSYYRKTTDGVSLVLCGPGERDYSADGIRDLGFVSIDEKQRLLHHSTALVQPSENESYSRAVMESWLHRRPVVVHRRCLATQLAVSASGGGLCAETATEWIEAFEQLADESRRGELAEMGERGARFAESYANWSRVVARILQFIETEVAVPHNGYRVDQILQTMEFADAISEDAVQIQERLRRAGFESRIFAEMVVPRMAAFGERLAPDSLAKTDAILYHHSIGTDSIAHVAERATPAVLVYHNITPAEFFEPYNAEFAQLLRKGRHDLATVVQHFQYFIADSHFNAEELAALGVEHVHVIPPVLDFSRFDLVPADISFDASAPHWLYVGRIAPNKGVQRLLEAFDAYVNFVPAARLSLVGRYLEHEPYYQSLRAFCNDRGLGKNVEFRGVVDNAALAAFYENCDLFISLSEHEGFCVPLIEAMFYDLPVVARNATAVPETLGPGGVLVNACASAYEIAALAHLLVSDAALRDAVIDAQRERRRQFIEASGDRGLETLVRALLER